MCTYIYFNISIFQLKEFSLNTIHHLREDVFYPTMINLPKSNNLSDKMFERKVFIKTNLKLADNCY